MTRKSGGRIITIIGIIILGAFAFADLLGIGQTPDEIGYRQLVGVLVGALLVALGSYVSRR